MSEAMTYKLPPLPEPKALGMDFDNGWDGVRAYGYTAEQMQAYALAAIEAQGVPDGWQLVPKEPTDEMLKEAVMERHGSATYRAVDRKGCEALEEEAKSDWAVMLASAPPAPQAKPQPLSDEQAKKLCAFGPVYAPNGLVERTGQEYRQELEAATLRGLRIGEAAHNIGEKK